LHKRWLSAGLILLAVTLSNGLTAHADSDYSNALATAPQGILLDKTDAIMTLGTASMSSAAVVDTTNPAAPNTQAARLTDGPNQFGAVWSTDDNYFNLKEDETVSMWMYFGDKGTKAADGMAFVLQNDSNGIEASPKFGRFGVIGETLGVFGIDKNPVQSSNMGIANTAIQNSWAVEFDTAFNNQTGGHAAGQGNSFDIGFPAAHIASSYPGLATTYHQYVDPGTWGITKTNYYYSLQHNGLITNSKNPGFLANGQWHHVTIHWNDLAETMTYTFNDRNPQTGEQQPGVSRTVRLNQKTIDPTGSNRVRWGITGATGSRWSNNLIVFESTPGNIKANTRTTLTDLTREREIQDRGTTVANDQVRLDYHLDYRDGRQPWSSIIANLKLPESINFEEAKITYSGDRVPETLDVSKIKDNQLLTELGYAMDSAYPSATISLTGRVAPVSKTTKVARTSSTFSSNALIRTVETPAFTINPSVDLNLSVTSGQTVNLKAQEGTTVAGRVDMTTNAATGPLAKLAVTLNKMKLPDVALNADGTFTLPVTNEMLRQGTNTLNLRAVTADGDRSNLVAVTITVTGELKFSYISPNESFQNSTLTDKNQLVHRDGDWQLVVQDTRGTGSQWTLMAQATPFVSEVGAKLGGGPVYVSKRGVTPIGANPTPVLTHTMTDANLDGKFNVAAHWEKTSGVLLAVDSGTTPGNYSGSITWTLEDAPQ